MTFGELLSRYYTFIFILVLLLYTIFINRKMYSRVKGRFLTIITFVVLETVFSALEIYFAAQAQASIWRMVLSTVCYILRPAIIYQMLLIIIRDERKKKRLLLGSPLFAVSLILLVNMLLSSGPVFSYSEGNLFDTGPSSL